MRLTVLRTNRCATRAGWRVSRRILHPPRPMRLFTRVAPLFALAACATAGGGTAESAPTETLPSLDQVTRVVITDASTGKPLGAVARADSVASLTGLYARIRGGWTEGGAASPEIRAAFYRGSAPVALLALGSGSFEARVGGRMLHRPAQPTEAFDFARLTGVPIMHLAGAGSARPVIDSLILARATCPMPVLRPDTALLERMPFAAVARGGLEQMPVVRSTCQNPFLIGTTPISPPRR